MAAGRSEERRFRLLRDHSGRRAVVLRRPLPNGLSVAAGATEGATRAPRRREFMAPVVRRRATLRADLPLRLPKYADQTGRVRARFAPGRSGLDEQRPQADLARFGLDIGPAVREPHRG